MTWLLMRHDDPWGIDDDTMERLLRGAVASADAPPEYAVVARSFAAVTAPPTPVESADTTARVAEILAVIDEIDVRPRRRVAARVLTAVAATAGVLTLTSGLAVAGALPDAVQRVASPVL